MLSNGDLVIDATSTDDDAVGLYECVATFNTVGYHNITLARYNVTSLESHSAGKLTNWMHIHIAGIIQKLIHCHSQ